jgi:hypothetical protein
MLTAKVAGGWPQGRWLPSGALTLLVSVLGVLAAAAVVRGARSSVPLAGGVAVVITVLAIVTFANEGPSLARKLNTQYATDKDRPRAQLNNAGGAASNAREDFLAFAEQRIPSRARVWLVCEPTCGGMEQWVTWRLLPRPFVDSAEDADWVLMYNALPRDAGLRGAAACTAVRFDKRLYLARVVG